MQKDTTSRAERTSASPLGPRAGGRAPQSPSPNTRGLFTLWQTAAGGGPIRIPGNRVRRRGSAPPDPPQSLGNPQPQRRQQRLGERDPRPGTGGCGVRAAGPPWRPPKQAPCGRRAPWATVTCTAEQDEIRDTGPHIRPPVGSLGSTRPEVPPLAVEKAEGRDDGGTVGESSSAQGRVCDGRAPEVSWRPRYLFNEMLRSLSPVARSTGSVGLGRAPLSLRCSRS